MEEVRRIGAKGQIVCVIEFNGHEYKRYPNGKHPKYYYRKWKKNGVYYSDILHQAIYRFHHGEIPEGKVIHHIDFNAFSNNIDNLVALTPTEHSQAHSNLKKYNQTEAGKKNTKTIAYSKTNWEARRKIVVDNLAKDTIFHFISF